MTEFRPGGFNIIPPVIKNLVILNALIFFAQLIFRDNATGAVSNYFALHDIHSELFKPHQIITYMFLHGGWDHIFFNMFALWMFGSILENLWGAKRFLVFYMACGIGAGLLHLAVLYYENAHLISQFNSWPVEVQEANREGLVSVLNSPTLGASGAVFGCLAAFGYLFPNSLIYLYFFIPIRAKWFVLFYGGMELWLAIRNSAGDNVAHWAHLGGAVVGLIIVWIWNKTNRRTFY